MYKVAVIGLRMGANWALAAKELPNTELVMLYDKFYEENNLIIKDKITGPGITVAKQEEEIYASDADIDQAFRRLRARVDEVPSSSQKKSLLRLLVSLEEYTDSL